MAKTMTQAAVLKEFFNLGTAKEAMDQLKKLSADERRELAVGAAKEMGVEIEAAK